MPATYVTEAELRAALGIGALYSSAVVEEVCQAAENIVKSKLWFNDYAVVAHESTTSVATIYTNTFDFATGIIASPTQWANFIALNDTAKRPILTAIQPMNAMGSVGIGSLRGNLLGLDIYVDYTETGDGDATIVVLNRDSFTWYESPRLQLRAETVGSGKIEIGLYGYGALATKKPKGAFRFNKA